MNDKPAEPTTAEIQAAHDADRNFSPYGPFIVWADKWKECDTHRGILLRRLDEEHAAYHLEAAKRINLDGQVERLQARLDELEYRHECCKSLYEDATNCPDLEQAETDIDEFIREEQSHS